MQEYHYVDKNKPKFDKLPLWTVPQNLKSKLPKKKAASPTRKQSPQNYQWKTVASFRLKSKQPTL